MFKKMLFTLFISTSLFAQGAILKAGEDYTELAQPLPVPKGKATIIEFFSYGCPACFNLEKTIEPWIQAHKHTVKFSRIPVIFHTEWETYAKAYYIAESLNLQQANETIFKAVQVDRTPLENETQMADFFIKTFKTNPVLTKNAFENSTTISLEVKKGMMNAAELEINRIPAFVINGRYITDLGMAKEPERLLVILNELIKK